MLHRFTGCSKGSQCCMQNASCWLASSMEFLYSIIVESSLMNIESDAEWMSSSLGVANLSIGHA